jgi:hypothetical protein
MRRQNHSMTMQNKTEDNQTQNAAMLNNELKPQKEEDPDEQQTRSEVAYDTTILGFVAL